MAFDESLAERIRRALGRTRNIAETKMFGSLGFLLRGNMLVGIWKDSLIVRLGDEAEAALLDEHVRPFDITGKAMTGWAMVDADGVANDEQVKAWVQRATAFVRTLPAK